MKKIKNYIDGKLLEPKSKKYLKNFNPATGKVYSLTPNSGKEDVELAVSSAKKSFCCLGLKNQKRAL